MDTATMIKYAMAIQRIKTFDINFDPPDGRVIVYYTDPSGPQKAKITFAELSDLLTTTKTGPPAAPPD